MSAFKSGWYLLYTRPQHEIKVLDGLTLAGIEGYVPRTKTPSQGSRNRGWASRPLFPCYVFVKINSYTLFFHPLKIPGVVKYVKLGKDVVRVHDDIVTSIRQVAESGERVESTLDSVEPGQIYTVSSGPMTGVKCEVISVKSEMRIVVRVSLLNRTLLLHTSSLKLSRA